MKDDLGGAVLPYYDLGFTDRLGLGTTWDAETGILTFTCSGTYDATALQAIKTLYEGRDGWSVTIVGDVLTAVNATLGITVVIGKDADTGCYTMAVTYVEPFDPTKATDWTADIKTAFQTSCNDFDGNFGTGSTLPFVYLGTVNPTIHSAADNNVELYGGAWNDQILTLAKAAWPTTGDSPEWTYAESISSTGNSTSTYTFTKVFKDAAGALLGTITCKLLNYAKYVSSGVYRHSARLTVHYKGKFIIPATATDWSQDTKDKFTTYYNNFDGNFGTGTLPYVYLGTVSETSTYSSYSNYIQLVGGDDSWDDQILANAKLAYPVSDGWTETDNTAITNQTFAFEKTFKDAAGEENGKIKVTLIRYTVSTKVTPRMQISYLSPFRSPAGATTWNDIAGMDSSKTKYDLDAQIATFTNNHVIPYFYLGSSAVTPATGTDSTKGKYLELKGGYWDDKVLTLSQAAFTADTALTWTAADQSATDSTIPLVFEAEDAATEDKIKVELQKSTDSIPKVNLYIFFTMGWSAPTPAAWAADVSTAMTTNLGEAFPYVYMGTDAPVATWDATNQNIEIQGVNWESSFNEKSIFAYAQKELEADTTFAGGEWTFNSTQYVPHATTGDEEYGAAYHTSGTDKMFSAQVKNKAGTKIFRFELFRYMDAYSYSNPALTTVDYLKAIIHVYDAYQTPATAGSWDAAMVTSIQTKFGSNVVIPFVYLNSAAPAFAASSSTTVKSATISGGIWDSQFLIDAAGDFTEADGWSTYENENPSNAEDNGKSFFKSFPAVTDATSGTTTDAQMIGVTLSEEDDCAITITSYDVTASTATGVVGYNDDVKTKINANTDNNAAEIPYFYLNTTDDLVTATASNHTVTVVGGEYSVYSLVEADKALAGWDTVKRSYFSSIKTFTKAKTLADGSVITMAFSRKYVSASKIYAMSITITFKEGWAADSTAVAWNSDVTTAFTDKFGADFVMPVIYFGTTDAEVVLTSSSTTQIALTGGDWIANTISRIEGQLDKDTADTTNNRSWTYLVAYKSTTPYLYAVTKAYDAAGNDTGKHITLEIYNYSEKVRMNIFYR